MDVNVSGSRSPSCVEFIIAGPFGTPAADEQIPTLAIVSTGIPFTTSIVDPVTHWTIAQGLGNGQPETTYTSVNSIGGRPEIRYVVHVVLEWLTSPPCGQMMIEPVFSRKFPIIFAHGFKGLKNAKIVSA